MVQCWENTTMFILFYSSLFYFIWLTADYTNIVASCVALPNSIYEHVDTNNMNIYDIYNELIQMKVMLCICKPFPLDLVVYWLSVEIVPFKLWAHCSLEIAWSWWSRPSNGGHYLVSVALVVSSHSPGWMVGPTRSMMAQGLCALSLLLCALPVWRDFSLGCHSGFQ